MKEKIKEVAHLMMYATCEQRVSENVFRLFMDFWNKYGFELTDEEYLIYSTKYSNMDMYDDPNNYWYKK